MIHSSHLLGPPYVNVNSLKEKRKELKEHFLKDLAPRGFSSMNCRVPSRASTFFQEQDNRIKAIHYENVGLQGEIQSKDQERAA